MESKQNIPDFLETYKPTEEEGVKFDDDTDDEAGNENGNDGTGAWTGFPVETTTDTSTTNTGGWGGDSMDTAKGGLEDDYDF